MQSKHLKKENILTIPNLLSLIRILLIPFIIWLYCVQKAYMHTFIVIVISGFTDIIDGKIARKFNEISDVGKVLDPIADKLTQAALVICLIARYPWMWALLALFAVKECLMLLWGYLTLKSTDTINGAKWYGKLSTVVLYAVMMILILFVDIPQAIATALMLLCGGMMLLSLVMYGRFYHAILDQAPSGSQQQKTLHTARNVVLGLIWVGIIVILFIHREELSAEGIARYTPKNPWLAAIVMLALFALKSLSIVIYSGLLYAANGILFPLPVAIVLNLIGTVIMVSLPYLIGKRTGASAVDEIRAKYPKAEAIHDLRAKNDFLFAFLVRMARLPSDVASLYMGAVHVEYKKYLLGSLLGMLPHTITYPIIGMSIRDIRSPQFIISLCAEIAYILVTSAVYTLYRKKNQADQ